MKVNGLILAAGMSKRMQQFKPLMQIGNRTMIEVAVDQMLKAQIQQVTVVLGYRSEDVRRVLLSCDSRKGRIQFVYNRNYETTQMLDSVKAGLSCMDICDWFFVAPGDMPAISVDTYRTLCEKGKNSEKKVIFPVLDGYRKHPPLVAWSCREEILKFQGMGLRELWKQYEDQIMEVPLSDQGCTMDVDFPADYQKVCQYISDEGDSRLYRRRVTK